jgi:hypothetical protein
MHRVAFAILLGLMLAGLVPSAGASPVGQGSVGIVNPSASAPVKLYFHLVNIGDFPINTQLPPADYTYEQIVGTTLHTLTCAPDPGVTGFTKNDYSTSYGVASPGQVEYDTPKEKVRIHPERGIGYDGRIDAGKPSVIHWYVVVRTGSGQADAATGLAPPVPDVVARATVRLGERISIDDQAYNQGSIVAQGQTPPTTLAGAATYSGAPGGPHPQVTVDDLGSGKGFVYGFHVPLTYGVTTLESATGFNVRMDLFIATPACDIAKGQAIMTANVHPFTDAGHRPGWDLAVLNPMRIAYLHPQFFDKLVILHASIASLWGKADLDNRSFIAAVIDPLGHAVPDVKSAPVPRRYSSCCREAVEPTDATFLWTQAGAAPGTYEVRFRATNLQGTANATATASFTIGKHLQVVKCGTTAYRYGAPNATIDISCRQEFQDDLGNPLDPASFQSPAWGLMATTSVLLAVAWLRRAR